MNEFFSWEFLSTFAGSVVFVTTVTEVVKYYLPKLDPKIIALVAAIFVSLSVQLLFYKNLSSESIILSLFNIVVILFGSIGAFESIIKPISKN